MATENQTAQVETEVPGKTVLSFSAPTPMWATWLFRIIFLVTTAALFVVAGDPAIPDALKVRLSIYLKALDLVSWGLARSLGIKKEEA